MQWWLTIASIRLAVICLVLFLICRQLTWRKHSSDGEQTRGDGSTHNRWPVMIAKNLWFTGSVLSLVHLLAAYSYVHHWSHLEAVAHTAEQTRELTGLSAGFGIYFNFLFVGLWLGDAIWLMGSEDSYLRRGTRVDRVVYGYLVFIAFNGAVVFVSGWFRWLSAALFLILVFTWLVRRPTTHRSHCSDAA